MAGAAVYLKHNNDQVQARIREVARRCGHTEPALEIIGAHMVDSVIQNFEAEGRPTGWQQLSPATLAAKKGGAILRVQGMAGGLMGSIHYKVEPHQVLVGTDKVYGAIHQFGGETGRGHQVTMPAREYLLVQDEDWIYINEQLDDYILQF